MNCLVVATCAAIFYIAALSIAGIVFIALPYNTVSTISIIIFVEITRYSLIRSYNYVQNTFSKASYNAALYPINSFVASVACKHIALSFPLSKVMLNRRDIILPNATFYSIFEHRRIISRTRNNVFSWLFIRLIVSPINLEYFFQRNPSNSTNDHRIRIISSLAPISTNCCRITFYRSVYSHFYKSLRCYFPSSIRCCNHCNHLCTS